MNYQALYRKYRPKTFDDIYGQQIIVQTLKNIIKNNKLTHAYLFIGPRGTGKTSIAKVFAKTINCLSPKDGLSCEKCDICVENNNNENVDIIEMDAASNNGVDEIREIKNHVTLMPTTSKYKVYIIDEVHMLTTGAFNALLKTLEEPPKHVIFILATTEPHKIPLTIISRCQSFEFKPIQKNIIKDRLNYICEKENIKIDEKSLDLIAIDSNGGMRDAIGLLDQLNAYSNGNIKYEDVLLLNGRISTDDLIELLRSTSNSNLKEAYEVIDKIESDGKNFIYICDDLIKLLRDELVSLQTKNESLIDNIIDKDKITDVILLINKSISDMKNSIDKRIFFDILIMKIYELLNKTNVRVIKQATSEDKPKEKEIKPQKNINTDKKDYALQEELMNIRLNNILAKANKKDLVIYSEQIKKLNNEIINLDQLRIANVLSDFEIKAASNDGVVLTTKTESLLNTMYDEILNADEILSTVMNKEIKICVLLDGIWNEKREFYVNKIKNKETIENLDESDIIIKLKESTKEANSSEFDDLIEIGG